MIIPDTEFERFKAFLKSEASRYGLSIDEYISKVWYHEQAAKLGEYVALSLKDTLFNVYNTGEL